jgi:hypothetical protein
MHKFDTHLIKHKITLQFCYSVPFQLKYFLCASQYLTNLERIFVFYYSLMGNASLKFYLFQYINCFGKASTSVFFSLLLIVKTACEWPKTAETCSRW